MPQSTQAELDLYYLIRNIRWQYQLADASDIVVERLRSLLEALNRELTGQLVRYSPEMFTAQRIDAVLEEIALYSAAVSNEAVVMIAEGSGAVGSAALAEHYSILSLDGAAKRIASPGRIGGVEFAALLASADLGGRHLQGWVTSAFEAGAQQKMRDAVQSGVFLGEGYRKIVNRVMREGIDITIRDATTLARTYVQTASAQAQEAVYQANSDVVGHVKWSATLEPGYKQTGRGTCLRCSALDGQKWKLNEKRPPWPLHPNCRCFLLPVVDWAALGLPSMDLHQATRPYTIRPDENIGAGGRRKIEEVGLHDGDYASWLAKRSDEFQVNAMGPNRFELYRQGVPLEAFVDRRTGELLTLDELKAVHNDRRR